MGKIKTTGKTMYSDFDNTVKKSIIFYIPLEEN